MIINTSSGQGGSDALAPKIGEALEALGAKVAGSLSSPGTIGEQLAHLRRDQHDVIVAVGGDGTVNAAATVAAEQRVPLLIVPSGTMNLVAQDLNLPTEIGELIDRITDLVPLSIDFASVNGHAFFHSSLLGIVPRLTTIRERMRSAESRRQWGRSAWSYAVSAITAPDIRVTLRSERGDAVRFTKSLAVTCNPLADGELGSHRRGSLASGLLGVYAAVHRGPLASVRLLTTLLSGRMYRDREIDYGACSSLLVRMSRSSVRVANDGEIIEVSTPLEYRVHRRELTVLVPRVPNAETTR